jgi:hypothetical protein
VVTTLRNLCCPKVIDDWTPCVSILGISRFLPALVASIYFGFSPADDAGRMAFTVASITSVYLPFAVTSFSPDRSLQRSIFLCHSDTESVWVQVSFPRTTTRLPDMDQLRLWVLPFLVWFTSLLSRSTERRPENSSRSIAEKIEETFKKDNEQIKEFFGSTARIPASGFGRGSTRGLRNCHRVRFATTMHDSLWAFVKRTANIEE